jgi:ferredoxin-NADP reductase
MSSPFHEGERAVQRRLGVHEGIEPWARKVVRPTLPSEHQAFYAALPFLVAAARDEKGRPWATLLTGRPGFAQAPDARSLAIATQPARGDALEHALAPGADLGLLGIELATRRRNRVNGRVASADAGGFVLGVEQSFGNCPQYIHERDWKLEPEASTPRRRHHTRFSPELTRWIRRADTFFIATGHRGRGEDAAFGMDASHRGGEPGFVRVEGERHLVFPDYAGNNHFNTIGNLLLEPRAGLLFVDFETGSLLQLTGRIEIDWDSPALSDAGSHRLLRVVEKIRESDDVTSFVFEERDGDALPAFESGQHLPIELEVPGQPGHVRRTYSLSSGPGDPRYRISVKREARGLASAHLHDHLEPGDLLDARTPAGDFVLRPGSRPLVLLSTGIGLTPLLSMLRDLVAMEDERPVWFVHGARDGRHHPLAEEIRHLVARHGGARSHVRYSRPRRNDEQGRDYDTPGRVDGELIASLLPDLDADFYLCGPTSFMAGMQDDLEARGVPNERIHSESFGPVG